MSERKNQGSWIIGVITTIILIILCTIGFVSSWLYFKDPFLQEYINSTYEIGTQIESSETIFDVVDVKNVESTQEQEEE